MRLAAFAALSVLCFTSLGCGSKTAELPTEFTPEQDKVIADLKELGVEVSGKANLVTVDCKQSDKVTDDDIAKLGTFKGLVTLRAKGTAVGDKAIKALGDCTEIVKLELGEKVTDAAVEDILKMGKLRTLDIEGAAGLTDTGGVKLAGHENLRILYLSKTGIGDDTAKAIAKMPNINDIHLGYTKVGDEGVKALAECKTLANVYLYSLEAKDESFEAIRKAIPDVQLLYGEEQTEQVNGP